MENHIDVTTDVTDQSEDKDMEKLLAVLRSIPQERIPDQFDRRLSQALKEEGSRIREKRGYAGTVKKRKWHLKAAAAAACFLVVFASLSMYNEGMGSFTGANPEEAPVDSELELSAKRSAIASEDSQVPERENDQAMSNSADQFVAMAENNSSPEPAGGTDGNADEGEQGEIYYGLATTEADILCREGGKYIAATDEYWTYRNLLNAYLAGYAFSLIDCERDAITGSYRFKVEILTDPEGQAVNAPMILIGECGEIYEQQAEGVTDGEEPQTGGD